MELIEVSQRQFSHQSRARGGSEAGAPSLAGSSSELRASCQGERRRSRTTRHFPSSHGVRRSGFQRECPSPGSWKQPRGSETAPGALREGQCPQEVTGSSAEQTRHYKNKNADREGCRESSSSLFSCEIISARVPISQERSKLSCHFRPPG